MCLLRLLTLENVLVHCGVGHGSLPPRIMWSRDDCLEAVEAMLLQRRSALFGRGTNLDDEDIPDAG